MAKKNADGTSEQRLIRYIIANAEGKRNADASDPEDVALTFIGKVTTNGKDRKTGRVNLTVEQMKREGFAIKADNKARTVEIVLPSNRAGRKPLSGTDLESLLS